MKHLFNKHTAAQTLGDRRATVAGDDVTHPVGKKVAKQAAEKLGQYSHTKPAKKGRK